MHMTMHFQIKVFKLVNLSKWLSRHIFIPQAFFFQLSLALPAIMVGTSFSVKTEPKIHAILESHDNARVLIFNLKFLFFRDSTWNMVT